MKLSDFALDQLIGYTMRNPSQGVVRYHRDLDSVKPVAEQMKKALNELKQLRSEVAYAKEYIRGRH